MSDNNIPTIDNDALRRMLAEGGAPGAKKEKKVFEKDKRLYNTYIDLKKHPEHNAIIRFLPPSEQYPNWFVKGMKHKPSKGKNKPFLDLHCPKYYDSTHSCAICDYLAGKWNEFTKEERNLYKRKVYFLANILVVKDEQNPDLEGRVMLWNYPQSIHDKIMNIWAPKDQLEEPCDVFNYDGRGRNFKLKICKTAGADWYDYDACTWANSSSALYGGDTEKINAVHASLYNLAEVIDGMRKYDTSESVKNRFEKYMNPPMLNENEDERRFDQEPDFTPQVLREHEREKTNETVAVKTETSVAPTPKVTSATTAVPEIDIDF